MLKLILKSLVLALLLLVISGCSVTTSSQYGSCPKFYEQAPKNVLPKTQIKSFDHVSFIHDDSVSFAHAECRFNNTDGDNEMINVSIINTYDLGVMLEHGYYNYEIIMTENTRSRKFWPDNNNTKE